MVEIKNLIDLVMVFGAHSQEALDFISDETNNRKLHRFLSFNGETGLEPQPASTLVQNERTNKETKIRIAVDNGEFLTKEEWKASKYSKNDVIGIAVITPCVQFILALDQLEERWSEHTDCCITGKYNEAQALQVISGYEHTKQLVEAQEDEGNTAAKTCWHYGYKGLQWYLPCPLELCAVCANAKEINNLLELVGGKYLDLEVRYWSSIENSAGGSWGVNFSDGGIYCYGKCSLYVARPVVAI